MSNQKPKAASREVLRGYFSAGKQPTGEQFAELIESFVSRVDDGITVDAGKIDATEFIGNGTIPKGGIILWYGHLDKIPSGWTLCDGRDETPDLTDRFIVGAGGRYQALEEGGRDEVNLETQHLPSFMIEHQIGLAGFPRSLDSSGTVQATQDWGHGTTTEKLVAWFANQPLDIRPRFRALAYIMRTE